MKNLLEKMISNALTFHLYLIPKMSLAHEHYRQVNIV